MSSISGYLDNDSAIKQRIQDMLPERFSREIKEVTIVPLKFKNKSQKAYSVKIQLASSVYYPNSPSASLCKYAGNEFYFAADEKHYSLESEIDMMEFKNLLPKKLEGLFPAETFGCCGLYKSCSAALMCLHKNAFYASACMYKKNLESGKVFY